jgi:hypothetical protein
MPNYNTACSIPANAKTNASLQPPTSSLPPRNIIHLQTCTTGTHHQNTRSAPTSTTQPNMLPPLESYFPPALDSHHHHFTYNMTTVPKPSGTNNTSPNGTPNAILIFHQQNTRQTTQPTTKNTSTKQLNS